jgi:hypothetical protein
MNLPQSARPSLIAADLENHAPGWTRRLLDIRGEIRRYQAELADTRMILKELALQESRLLRTVEAIAAAVEAGDPHQLEAAIESYRNGQ